MISCRVWVFKKSREKRDEKKAGPMGSAFFLSDYHRTSAGIWVPWQHLAKVLHFVCEIRESREINSLAWIPAFAGMTGENRLKISGYQVFV
ncbi:MAG: hypothetical protein KKH22_11805 [Proteobacteria bacterium]|nr:hypothetical protein [Pseudomonadota bacterium]